MATVACLIAAAAGAWSSLTAAPEVRFGAAVVLAAVPALLVPAPFSRRTATSLTALCVPGVMLVAGVPAAAFVPGAWPQLLVRLGSGAAPFVTPGSRPPASAWSLTVVMLVSGAVWLSGAKVVASGRGSSRRLIIGFVLLTGPWLAGVCERTPDHAAWLGALVLLPGVLLFTSAVLTIPLGVITALLSVAIAQAVGPHTRWFGLGRQASVNLPFRSLDTEPTYGPLTDRRTGAPMLMIRASEPALWRMQTLDFFDGSGWTTAPQPLPELSQPAAYRREITVRVLGLRQSLVVAPGRIDRVDARAAVARSGGEAWQLAALPRIGATYRVVASTVRVSPSRLALDHNHLDSRARVYTHLSFATQGATGLPLLGWLFGAFGVSVKALRQPAVDPRVAALARRLELGARSELDKVARVERYLLGGGRFRYTTQVPIPGPYPLDDFLLRTHAGYCEHFAGAAALLLRLAGVPARVVAGFATGRQTGPGRYTLRDLDAHDWIEVYFPGYGWVPFNPTPSAGPATIAHGLDPLSPPTLAGGKPKGVPVASLLSVLTVAGVGLVLLGLGRRARRGPTEPLERIARHTGGQLEPSTTLAQLGVLLARIGPRTAALAAEAERARFAPGPAVRRCPRITLARALVRDVGPIRALLVWAPLPYRRPRRSR